MERLEATMTLGRGRFRLRGAAWISWQEPSDYGFLKSNLALRRGIAKSKKARSFCGT
jgi:hypothetical protein